MVEALVAPAPSLVAAVSNAGGLGPPPVAWLDDADGRAAVRAARELSGRPFGVNLVLDEPRDRQLEAALAEEVAVVTFF